MLCIMIFKSLFKSRPQNLHFIEVVEHMITSIAEKCLEKPLIL